MGLWQFRNRDIALFIDVMIDTSPFAHRAVVNFAHHTCAETTNQHIFLTQNTQSSNKSDDPNSKTIKQNRKEYQNTEATEPTFPSHHTHLYHQTVPIYT